MSSGDHHTFHMLWKSENVSFSVQLSLQPSLKEHLLKELIRKCSHSCLGVPWWFFFPHQHLLFTELIMKCKKNYLGERISSSSMFSPVLLLLLALLSFFMCCCCGYFHLSHSLWAVSWGPGLIPARLTWEYQPLQLIRDWGTSL